jgi:hypothetical protein
MIGLWKAAKWRLRHNTGFSLGWAWLDLAGFGSIWLNLAKFGIRLDFPWM